MARADEVMREIQERGHAPHSCRSASSRPVPASASHRRRRVVCVVRPEQLRRRPHSLADEHDELVGSRTSAPRRRRSGSTDQLLSQLLAQPGCAWGSRPGRPLRRPPPAPSAPPSGQRAHHSHHSPRRRTDNTHTRAVRRHHPRPDAAPSAWAAGQRFKGAIITNAVSSAGPPGIVSAAMAASAAAVRTGGSWRVSRPTHAHLVRQPQGHGRGGPARDPSGGKLHHRHTHATLGFEFLTLLRRRARHGRGRRAPVLPGNMRSSLQERRASAPAVGWSRPGAPTTAPTVPLVRSTGARAAPAAPPTHTRERRRPPARQGGGRRRWLGSTTPRIPYSSGAAARGRSRGRASARGGDHHQPGRARRTSGVEAATSRGPPRKISRRGRAAGARAAGCAWLTLALHRFPSSVDARQVIRPQPRGARARRRPRGVGPRDHR